MFVKAMLPKILFSEDLSRHDVKGVSRTAEGIEVPAGLSSDSRPLDIECSDIVRHMSFNVGNAVRSLWHISADCSLEDLNTAMEYLKDEVERLSIIKKDL